MKDYIARIDAAHNEIWEPLWRIKVQLFPVEKELLQTKYLRRLQFVHHGGAAYINTHHTYSRLQHTLGVFALVTYFEPENIPLRVASLLHDVGHAPLSHTLEGIPDVDHHKWTEDILFSTEIVEILTRYGLNPVEIMKYMNGENRSILRNNHQILHLDHLDSWVRSAHVAGILPLTASEILAGLEKKHHDVQMTLEMGRIMVTLILEEAAFHTSPTNIGINTVMKELVHRLYKANKIDVDQLPYMTDSMIECALRSCEQTSMDFGRLMNESWKIQVSQDPSISEKALTTTIRKLYLSMPLVDGRSIVEIDPSIQERLQEAEKWKGIYCVSW